MSPPNSYRKVHTKINVSCTAGPIACSSNDSARDTGRNYISFDGRFQVECPATYKASPDMETGNCPTLGLRSKHLFFVSDT